MKHVRVADVMTAEVVAIASDASFKRAVHILADRGVSGAPVLGTQGEVVGVVSEADLLDKQAVSAARPNIVRRVLARWRPSPRRTETVADVMSAPAITTEPHTSVSRAAATLARHSIKRLPVVDAAGNLVGIVSRRDVLAVYLRPDAELLEEIRLEVLERAMWMDPASIQVAVEGGVVTLRGRVDRQSMIAIVTTLVSAVDGVVDVVAELEADEDDTRPPRVEPENVGILHRRRR